MSTNDLTQRVSDLWSDEARGNLLGRTTWMAAPAILLHLNRRATGDYGRDWLSSWAVGFFSGRELDVLVLGCGDGWLERALAPASYIRQIDAFDVAEGAVQRAEATAREAGLQKIRYGVMNLNEPHLPAHGYDVVIAHSVLHHVERLEELFAQLVSTLRPEGVLIVNEYVGPHRFQIEDESLRLINEILVLLPERLRRSAIGGEVYQSRTRATEEEMIEADPSEAVRSDEILGFVERHFDVVERLDLGGTLLQHLFYDIVQNFDFTRPGERSMIEIICLVEATLIDAGVISSDFVALAARRKGASGPLRTVRPPLHPDAASDAYGPDPLELGSRRAIDYGPERAAQLMKSRGVDPADDRWLLRIERVPQRRSSVGFPLMADLLRLLLLADCQTRPILVRRNRWREAWEQFQFTIRKPLPLPVSSPTVDEARWSRVCDVPYGTREFDYVFGRWSPKDEGEDTLALRRLVIGFERILYEKALIAPTAVWVLYRRMD